MFWAVVFTAYYKSEQVVAIYSSSYLLERTFKKDSRQEDSSYFLQNLFDRFWSSQCLVPTNLEFCNFLSFAPKYVSLSYNYCQKFYINRIWIVLHSFLSFLTTGSLQFWKIRMDQWFLVFCVDLLLVTFEGWILFIADVTQFMEWVSNVWSDCPLKVWTLSTA